MTSLRDRLLEFIAELRAAGVRISVAESMDALNAVAAAGIERERMREALAAALIKDEADRLAFDDGFERYFAAPPRERGTHPEHRGRSQSAGAGRGRPGDQSAPSAPPRNSPEPKSSGGATKEPARGEPGARKSSRESESAKDRGEQAGIRDRERLGDVAGTAAPGAAARRLATQRDIERKRFRDYTDLDYEQAREALAPLERRFRIKLGRRLGLARRGRVDLRRTIRAAIQRGGVPAELRLRARRPRHVDLLILADISGSVRYAAQLMLELMAGARGCFRRVASFVFIDRLAEAGFEQGHLVMTPALDLHARSDFGRVLDDLWRRRGELLSRQTLVVILGDARNNRRPARADLLREVARASRAVVWLNPEERERWGTGDSAIHQYEREVAMVLAARDLRELAQGLAAAA
jgi:uncharacterized protein